MAGTEQRENVYVFIPNLIGYLRIIFGLLAFWYCDEWAIFFWCYWASYFLDCFDGVAARYFNQATRFGQMLDMVTDRCSSACLFALLAKLYPGPIGFACYSMLALDLASHYCIVYSQLLQGTVSHKKMAVDTNWLLKIYYHNQLVLFLCCLLNETFFVMAYLYFHGTVGAAPAAGYMAVIKAVAYVCAPGMALKQYLNILQLMTGCRRISEFDVANRAALRAEAAKAR